jgi:CRP-like cAMP-binding protein
MSLSSDIGLLRSVPFFEGFADDHLKLIAFSAEERSFSAGMVLFEEGQPLHSAYLITSGLLEGTGKDGGARPIRPPELLAERALVIKSRAKETVRVKEAATALQFRRTLFRRFLEEYPAVAAQLRARIAARLALAAADYRRAGKKIAEAGP